MRPEMPGGDDVTPVQMWILLTLSTGPDYGYNLMQRLTNMFGGYWIPKAGTIYPALEKLTEAKLVTPRHEHREEGLDRRYYSLTGRGEETLNRGMERWSHVMEHIENYGNEHRSIRRHLVELTSEEAGEAVKRLGETLMKGSFDLSEPHPEVPPIRISLPPRVRYNLVYKRVHTSEGEKREIEVEIEWKPDPAKSSA